MPNDDRRLTYREIFTFWVPLAATWIMMGVELPFLAAIVARLAEPKFNLAAFGVAFSFALIIEAPIIMIMSASTALVRNKDSFFKLRNFTYVLNGLITIFMLIGLTCLLLHHPRFDRITGKNRSSHAHSLHHLGSLAERHRLPAVLSGHSYSSKPYQASRVWNYSASGCHGRDRLNSLFFFSGQRYSGRGCSSLSRGNSGGHCYQAHGPIVGKTFIIG